MTTKNEKKNGKDFYVVEFEFKIDENEEVKEAIESFYATKPHIYAQDNLEEILRNPETYALKKFRNWSLPAEFPNREFYLKMPVIKQIAPPQEQVTQEPVPQEQE
jgi:arginine/lysine/ornithine decarboxylase